MRHALVIWTFIYLIGGQLCAQLQYVLDGNDWVFYSTEANYTGKANVPGGIYSDLWRNGDINDPFFRDNDLKLRWVGQVNWVYSKRFSEIYLVCHGIDTISKIYVNTKLVGRTENMFSRYKFSVKHLLHKTENRIEIFFESPIRYAKKKHQEQGRKYVIPPICPPSVQNGACHVNYLRKIQSSFSWDWGPAFPSIGIWKSIAIEAYNYAMIRDILVDTILIEENHWAINTTLIVETATFQTFPALVKIHFKNVLLIEKELTLTPTVSAIIELNFYLPITTMDNIRIWWPNQVGTLSEKGFETRTASLYDITATISHKFIRRTTHRKTVRIGFRTIELIQDPGPNSLSFYLKINGHPIFLKGSNWIPGHILPERSKEALHMLEAVAKANMNMLRVWGGGIYELDEFYSRADELGILIWQDFMFAVALYPANNEFLASVKLEVSQQVSRIHHHPCIAIWAGNNENELAIASSWWEEVYDNRQKYKRDYIKLYIDTIRNEVLRQAPTIIYVPSSPSNGLQTQKDGWISTNPNSNKYGDVHYYNYDGDGWDWTKYPSCKLASEYGFQSYPSIRTFSYYFPKNELIFPFSEVMKKRQHSEIADRNIFLQLAEHFDIAFLFSGPASTQKLKQFIYLSQIEQAMSIKTETEFYRRNRKADAAGNGFTMGALFWQLNDVWAAPTWSSLEYGGKWKILHYFAVKFFRPIIVVPYLQNLDTIIMDVVNDALNDIELAIKVIVYSWNDFEPLSFANLKSNCTANTVCSIFRSNFEMLQEDVPCKSKQHCFIVVEYENEEGTFSGNNVLLLSKPKDIIGLKPSIVEVTIVKEQHISSEICVYEIWLTGDAISLFVWLDLAETSTVTGEFSDNGFVLVKPNKILTFTSRKRYTTSELKANIYVLSFNNVFHQTL